eukprot:scaffold98210_cov33-Phaeocystis_antarctica.AAC.1
MSKEHRAVELAAAHQHMRLRPLKRVETDASNTRLHKYPPWLDDWCEPEHRCPRASLGGVQWRLPSPRSPAAAASARSSSVSVSKARPRPRTRVRARWEASTSSVVTIRG